METMLLAGLPDAEARGLIAAARRRRFGRREVIFHEGDPGDTVHVVVKGHVGLRITTPLGDVAMVRVLGPTEFFGELAAVAPGPRAATAVAIESAETLAIHRDQFVDLLRRIPSAQAALTLALATEVRRLAGSLVEALYLPADKRLWRRLLDLSLAYGGEIAAGADDGPDAGPDGAPAAPTGSPGSAVPISSATVPLTQDEVAQLAGVTRPTANRLLREGEEVEAVALARGRIEIRDVAWVQRKAR